MKSSTPCQVLALTALLFATFVQAQEPAPPPPPAEPPRYTFSWPLDGANLKPRGGTSRGAPITLDPDPSSAWKALQESGLEAQERDRRAILAMAGTYRVSFDFLEVLSFTAPSKSLGPYQSWGTEKVYVDKNEPGFVSLVHILEMHLIDKEGKAMEPMVTKHWRQDWTYEPARLVEYKGRDRWQGRLLSGAERRGAWSQTVSQVDESPRYASLGRWQHTASFSTWISAETWRPLPRREWSVRDDYHTLLGTNRHTVGPTGWTQEENNLKAVLSDQREIHAAQPFLGREYGMARYERLRDANFAAADRYYERTRAFWDQVRGTWQTAFEKQGTVTLRGPVDKLGFYKPLFERASRIEEAEGRGSEDDAGVIRAALTEMGVFR